MSASDRPAHPSALVSDQPLVVQLVDEDQITISSGAWSLSSVGIAFFTVNGAGPVRRFIPWASIRQVWQQLPAGTWPRP